MKDIKPFIGRLVLGCVFALGFVSTVQAQVPLPDPGTNQPPPGGSTNTIDPAALEAAQQAQFAADFGPWLQQDASVLDDPTLAQSVGQSPATFLTAEQRFEFRQTQLEALAATNQEQLDAEQAEAQNYAASNNIPTNYVDAVGNTAILRRIEDGQPVYFITHDLAQANTLSVPAIWTNGATGLNLNGEGRWTGIFDVGDVLTTHQEFGGRVSNDDPLLPQDGHSMHVAGVIASAGVNANAKGMSPHSALTAYNANFDITKMSQIAATNRALLSNHSYGRVVGWGGQRFWYITRGSTVIANGYYPVWNGDATISKTTDYHFGLYNSDAVSVDTIIYNAGTYLPVWSAGNERGPQGLPNGVAGGANSGFSCGTYNGPYGSFVAPGDPNFPTPPADGGSTGFTTLSAHACAKNNLVVGSVANIAGGYQGSNSVVMSYFSSWGPTSDGRIKPDLTAPGENVFFPDTNSTSSYLTDSGTSFSAPAIEGVLNLLAEENTRLNGANAQLLASTLKGLAIHTADEAGTSAGPDYKYGWGLFNAKTAAQLFAGNAFSNGLPFIKEVRLFDGDYIEFPVTVTNGTSQLKATICWTDPPAQAAPNALNPTNLALINDLDLRVVYNGTTNFPWVLNPASPSSAAATGDNFRDNVEQVAVPSPAAGTYLVRVTHKRHILNAAGASSAQWVSIILSGVQPQPVPPLQITSAFAYSTNRLFALKWTTTVGVNYQILQNSDLGSGGWQPTTDVISATKTNAAFVLPAATSGNRFYRIMASRP